MKEERGCGRKRLLMSRQNIYIQKGIDSGTNAQEAELLIIEKKMFWLEIN